MTMPILTDDMRRMIAEQRLCQIASVNADGTPNLSPRGTLIALDGDDLAYAVIRSPRTDANIARSPAVEIGIVDPVTRKGYRFFGRARRMDRAEMGELVPLFVARGVDAGRIKGAVRIRVERALPVTSPSYDVGMSEVEIVKRFERHQAMLAARRRGITPEHLALDGQRVRLVPLEIEHVDGLIAAAAGDAALFAYFHAPIHTREAMAEWVAEAIAQRDAGAAVPYATVDARNGRIVGSTRFANIDRGHRKAEIGWTWIARDHQRSGLNVEAKYLQLRHAFEEWGLVRVELKSDAANLQSRKAMEGIGAAFEGVHRRHMIYADGRRRDSAWYGVTIDDWPSVKTRLEVRLAR
ncbi:MAG: GNAT family N-acetyltransferase [Alphaproteobacteria bacterium]|nr:GNAT family N-acetyltransferase [Alphaproteobacteria bacterium]